MHCPLIDPVRSTDLTGVKLSATLGAGTTRERR